MQKILLDSSIWISFLREKDIHHQQAKKIIHGLTTGNNKVEILVPEIVLAEVLNNISRLDGGQFANQIYREFISFDHIQIVSGKESFWLDYFPDLAGKENLKTADALILAYVQFLEVDKFYSFDKKLSKAFSRKK